ncbi:adenosylcobinamide-phosphate synthase [Rhizobium rhizosphaerae]|uniref:Cobalamin biosynthesis protein CobD n=1 Tax=Xaviernesmea rhizosphaerae TaxID=1672749 RepID=A0ABX3PJU8_9HYPH|nr:adenosylcobinamide-phosphate synthase CbiB [Xaviernesmea rhizosphaerae]OQP88382.1 adenosylcobinamide-phosphate synthase [Xaviernesmea rhizosphaerae]
MSRAVILIIGLLLDRLIGDPDWLWRRLPHPVVFFGAAISRAERLLNRTHASFAARRRAGVLAIVLLLLMAAGLGLLLHRLFALAGPLGGGLLEGLVVFVLLAQKSLADHVLAVAEGLRREGLEGGRLMVSMIVGRDPAHLDAPAVCRAAIESLAENFSDGVVAPAFWYLLAGLPGLMAYKMLNTADSMIGHKNERYLAFGWAAARLDDVANFLPARLSMFLLAGGAAWVAGRRAALNALSVGLRDSGLHRSPNSGWPEAAMAGALDIRLAGPRIYGGMRVEEPMMNGAGRGEATRADIERGVSIFYAACSLMTVTVLVLVLVLL